MALVAGGPGPAEGDAGSQSDALGSPGRKSGSGRESRPLGPGKRVVAGCPIINPHGRHTDMVLEKKRMRVRSWLGLLLAVSLLPAIGTASAQSAPPQPEQVPPAEFGKPFPTDTYNNLNPGSGAEVIDLSSTVGKKPVVFFYWIPGNPRADKMFQELQALVDEVGTDKLAMPDPITRLNAALS